MSDAPREDPAPLVDATGGEWEGGGEGYETQFGAVSEVDEETGHPRVLNEHVGKFDPRCLRFHDLLRPETEPADRRFSVQVFNDYEAGDDPPQDGQAPLGQDEHYDASNRSTREADATGRVALPSSHRRVVDAEDARYALALTCVGPPLTAPETTDSEPDEARDAEVPGEEKFTDQIQMLQPGSGTPGEGQLGSVTVTQPGVSLGGVTFFGAGAQQAAQSVLTAGGTPLQAMQAASEIATGIPAPPGIPGFNAAGPDQTREQDRDPALDAPKNPGGTYTPGRPAGYVWSRDARRVGLLGTLVDPGGVLGSYARGGEGTPIGPLPLRHDAHVSMGVDMTGRVRYEPRDASLTPKGSTPFRGAMEFLPGYANTMTDVGHETGQWVPVVYVDQRIAPSRKVSRGEFRIQEREREKEKEEDENKPPPGPQTGPGRPPGSRGPRPGGPPGSEGPPPKKPVPPKPIAIGQGREPPEEEPQPPQAGGGGPGGGGPAGGGSGGAQCGAGPGDKGPRGAVAGGGGGGDDSGGGGPASGGGGSLPEPAGPQVHPPPGAGNYWGGGDTSTGTGDVSAPSSQARNYEGVGVPCPNQTAGVENKECGETTADHVGGVVVDDEGRRIDVHGYPAVTLRETATSTVVVLGGSQPGGR